MAWMENKAHVSSGCKPMKAGLKGIMDINNEPSGSLLGINLTWSLKSFDTNNSQMLGIKVYNIRLK